MGGRKGESVSLGPVASKEHEWNSRAAGNEGQAGEGGARQPLSSPSRPKRTWQQLDRRQHRRQRAQRANVLPSDREQTGKDKRTTRTRAPSSSLTPPLVDDEPKRSSSATAAKTTIALISRHAEPEATGLTLGAVDIDVPRRFGRERVRVGSPCERGTPGVRSNGRDSSRGERETE